MDDDISDTIKKKRLAQLNDLCNEVALERNKLFEGKVLEVFAEGDNSGRSDNYKIVFWEGEPAKTGESVKVEITEALGHSLKGKRI